MAVTPSTMLPLGTNAPSFSLMDTTSGTRIDTSHLAGKVSVVAFICNHCPYVKHIRAGLADFGRYCKEVNVALVAISSNDAAAYPQDGPEAMSAEARAAGYVFPYLHDENQDVARAFQAACTPEFYVFNAAGKLAYRGQFDDSRPNNGKPVTGSSVRAAVDALLRSELPDPDQHPSVGCNIKWKPVRAP